MHERANTTNRPMRLLLVRHAQSANKGRREGQAAEADPGLTDLGHSQAEALGARLSVELARDGAVQPLVVSSPMRRCLLTIRPTLQRLDLAPGQCLCHGGAYEYGCAGSSRPGSSVRELAAGFPEFAPVCFSPTGLWDYRGENEKETESECRARGERLVEWIRTQVGEVQTLVLVSHQTMSDLVTQILINGSSTGWEYGDVTYRLKNASFTEVFLEVDGSARLGIQSSDSHLF